MTNLSKIDRNVNINSNGKVLTVVRETYLRDDIPCYSSICSICSIDNSKGKLSDDANYYIIPCIDVVPKYLEVLEHPAVKNVIFTQTVVMNTLHNGGRRYYNAIRNLLRDIRSNHVFFPNENHVETYCKVIDNKTKVRCQYETIYNTARWYEKHLQSRISIVILTEDKSFIKNYGMLSKQIFVLSVQEYLSTFLLDCLEIINICKLLNESLQETKSENSNTCKLYKEHLSPAFVQHGIANGKFLTGILKVSKFHSTIQASVTAPYPNKNTEILIFGMENRNRAVDNDEVVIELLPRSEWRGKVKYLDNGNKPSNNDDCEDTSSDNFPCAKVVSIVQRNWRDCVACFHLGENFVDRKSGNKVLVIPYDIRIPKIRINTKQAEKLGNQRIIVRIDSWPANSQYPNGHFIRALGNIGDTECETTALLAEHGISVTPFSEGMVAELPTSSTENPWTPTIDEIKSRRDLREAHFAFSIDPPGCEDVDDALSVKLLENGCIELGVHIADVTNFVLPDSLCDLEARSRTTTVYLADRRFDMLPNVLSADVCSLLSGVDRYAVSVIWTLDKNMNILGVWYGRTIIHSAYKLFYEAAQKIIDNEYEAISNNISELENLSAKKKQNELKKLKTSLNLLVDVSRHFRYKRLMSGGLELESVEVQFEINSDNEIDTMKMKQSLEIHNVVAELMILANHWVAKKIHETFPHGALLRRHPSPNSESLRKLVEYAKLKNFALNTETNEALSKSLNECVDENDPHVNVMLKKLATMGMAKALYFSSGSLLTEEFQHYGLALDFYTHFTSPIRRYADVIVHRLLINAIEKTSSHNLSNAALQDLCQNINEKSILAQNAQRASQFLFQIQYIKSKLKEENTLCCDAIISSIKTNGLIVDIPEYGINGAVYLKNKNQRVAFFRSCGEDFSREWIEGELDAREFSITVNTSFGCQMYTVFDHITVEIKTRVSNNAHVDKLEFEIASNKPHRKIQEISTRPSKSLMIKPNTVSIDDIPSQQQESESDNISLYQMFELLKNLSLSSS